MGPETVLSIEERGDTVLLHLADRGPHLVDRDGVLVFTGKAMSDLRQAAEISRKKRDRHFSKWADKVLTLNIDDFRRVWPGGKEIISIP